MKKHLIIHGDMLTGKSLFVKSLVSYKSHVEVSGRDPKFFELPFWCFEPSDKENEILIIDDINRKILPEEFFPYTTEFTVNAQNQHPFKMSPTLILVFSEELSIEHLTESFKRRFDFINTNTISYNELVQFLTKWNKNDF